MDFFLVFVGSGLGGMMRHGVGLASLRLFGPGFPYGTLAINIVGSAVMGLIVALFATLTISHPNARLFLTTGIVGGFTTFSTFSLDTVALWERGDRVAAIAYVAASVFASVMGLLFATHLVRRIV